MYNNLAHPNSDSSATAAAAAAAAKLLLAGSSQWAARSNGMGVGGGCAAAAADIEAAATNAAAVTAASEDDDVLTGVAQEAAEEDEAAAAAAASTCVLTSVSEKVDRLQYSTICTLITSISSSYLLCSDSRPLPQNDASFLVPKARDRRPRRQTDSKGSSHRRTWRDAARPTSPRRAAPPGAAEKVDPLSAVR